MISPLPKEILVSVLLLTNTGESYKSFTLVCKEWREILRATNLRNDMCNHLWTLMKLHPEIGAWSASVRDNPNTTHSKYLEFYKMARSFPASMYNPNIDIELAIEIYKERNEDGEEISLNPNVTTDIILKYPDVAWDWNCLCSNPNISLKTLFDNIGMIEEKSYVSRNPNITPTDVETYPDFLWDWGELSVNSNFTWEYICEYPERKWSSYNVSKNPSITLEIILANPNPQVIHWRIEGVSCNPNITLDIITNNPKGINGEGWDWSAISNNSNLTCEFVINNPSPPAGWYWYGIASNTFGRLRYGVMDFHRGKKK